MPSPETIELAPLLEPLSGDNPAGVDLRQDPSPTSLYYAVKDARSAARAGERQMVFEDDDIANKPDWPAVLRPAVQALAEKSKDLEVVAYLIEALVRLHGFAGLRDGFRLARELVERFWDQLYPVPDPEEGMAARVAPLTGLNGEEGEGTLITPIAKVPLTQGSNAGPFAYFHYQQALALAQVPGEDARQKRLEQGAVSLDMIARAVAETHADFFAQLTGDLKQCQEEFTGLMQALEERCASAAPPSSNIRTALSACMDAIAAIARDKLATGSARSDADGALVPAGAAAVNGTTAVAAPGTVRSREDAFTLLLRVADFFHQTEPHSPVSYALEQAVRWGRMSLPELMSELISDESARVGFFKQVGIRPPAPPAD